MHRIHNSSRHSEYIVRYNTSTFHRDKPSFLQLANVLTKENQSKSNNLQNFAKYFHNVFEKAASFKRIKMLHVNLLHLFICTKKITNQHVRWN